VGIKVEKNPSFAERPGEREFESQPPLSELFGSLFRQLAALVRDEIALAKAEVQDRIRVYRVAASIVVAGAVLGLLAAMAVVAAVIIALIPYLGAVWSPVAVGGLLGIFSLIAIGLGISQFRR